MHKDDIVNRALILLLGLLTGAMVFLVRERAPDVNELNVIEFHYSMIFLLLGLMPVLYVRARSLPGRAIAVYLIVTILVVVALEPKQLLFNGMLGMTVLLGSIAYFQFYGTSNTYFLLTVGAVVLELYGYGMMTVWGWYQRSDDLRFLLALAFLTVIAGIVFEMLRREFRQADGGSLLPSVSLLIGGNSGNNP
jgi:hypothetical protein